MRWFSHRRRTGEGLRTRGRLSNKMPHFLSPVTLTFDLDIRTRARFLYSAPNRQVSSSYVESFGSHRASKQTDKLTNSQTNRHRWQHPPRSAVLRWWVRTYQLICENTTTNRWAVCTRVTDSHYGYNDIHTRNLISDHNMDLTVKEFWTSVYILPE